KMKKVRNYDEDELRFGFSWTGDEEEPICYKTLTNETMKPSNLEQHFVKKHKEFFDSRRKDFQMCSVTGGENMKALETSYRVTYLIAKSGPAEVIDETLVKPAAKVMAQVKIGNKASKVTDRIPLSNNHRRIIEMAENVKQILLSRVRQIHDGLLFCQPMPGHSTAKAILKVIDDFIQENNLDCSQCVGISAEGAKAMIGSRKGRVPRIQAVAPEAKSTRCIHREALATVLNKAVKIVNFVKGRQLFDEMASDHTQLLFLTEVRWLSHGKVLNRIKLIVMCCKLRSYIYFPESDHSFERIRNPFIFSVQTLSNNLSHSEEQLLELASDGFLKTKFEQTTWTSVLIYPALSDKAVKYLLPFPTSYLCEVGFYALVGMKTKKTKRLIDMEPYLMPGSYYMTRHDF
ncbi:ZBED5 protein, partial [Atractosteus spatula]|nr:ZBED5 protein [Atractosteus spatula]